MHVVKNSIFRVAAKEAGVADLNGSLAGQMAVVTGQKDISAAAKAVKNFGAEFDKLKIKFGYLEQPAAWKRRTSSRWRICRAIDVLRAQILGVLMAPATKLAILINTPASQLAQVIKAKSEKAE